jgi:hypothetical protein
MMPKLLSTLRSLADAILGETGKPDRLDTATRMAMEAEFSVRGEPPMSQPEPERDVDPLAELIWIPASKGRTRRRAKVVAPSRETSAAPLTATNGPLPGRARFQVASVQARSYERLSSANRLHRAPAPPA